MSRYRRANLSGGCYFFTVNLADRTSALLVGHIERLRAVYTEVCKNHPFETIAICVLPEHLHAVWQLPEGDSDYALRWRLIKSMFSRGMPKAAQRSQSKVMRRETGIWQRRYWEHCIRDDEDLQLHVDYTHYNPVKHGHVSSVIDWPYSSFRRYVKQGWVSSDWAQEPCVSETRFGE